MLVEKNEEFLERMLDSDKSTENEKKFAMVLVEILEKIKALEKRITHVACDVNSINPYYSRKLWS